MTVCVVPKDTTVQILGLGGSFEFGYSGKLARLPLTNNKPHCMISAMIGTIPHTVC
jgi:hypothetical protein